MSADSKLILQKVHRLIFFCEGEKIYKYLDLYIQNQVSGYENLCDSFELGLGVFEGFADPAITTTSD